MACKDQHRCFPVNVAKFLRTQILKNICERLLKISNSAADLLKGGFSWFYYPFSPFSVLNFALTGWLSGVCLCNIRSSHRRCSLREGVLRNFAKLTGKHLYQSLFFNKVAGMSLQFYSLLKKRL